MPIGYWESEHLLAPVDLTVVGGGIVGMSTALHFRRLHPEASIRLLERDSVGEGGTTRNAGFACFGGPGEWLDDIKQLGMETWRELVAMRIGGLCDLVELLGADALGLEWCGGWELFADDEEGRQRASAVERMLPDMEQSLTALFRSGLGHIHPRAGDVPVLVPDPERATAMGAHWAVHMPLEGMLHTGKMVEAFHHALHDARVQRIHGFEVETLERTEGLSGFPWTVSDGRRTLASRNIAVCTNGFARQLLPDIAVERVPNRVLVVEPEKMPPVGTYHAEDGYLYFRPLPAGRILFGGGRQFGLVWPDDPEMEGDIREEWDRRLLESAEHWLGPIRRVTHRWTGWLGVGADRMPLIGSTEKGLFHAVRMGGMGVAVGCGIGRRLAHRISPTADGAAD